MDDQWNQNPAPADPNAGGAPAADPGMPSQPDPSVGGDAPAADPNAGWNPQPTTPPVDPGAPVGGGMPQPDPAQTPAAEPDPVAPVDNGGTDPNAPTQ